MTRRKGRGPRGVRAEERRLWEEVVRDTVPLRGAKPNAGKAGPEKVAPPEAAAASPPVSRPPKPQPKPKPAPKPAPAAMRHVQPRHLARELSFDTPLSPVGAPEAGIDRRTAQKLRRGMRHPDARIDLHGMSAERAHRALDIFIADALAAGHRCVLVITGKGGRRGQEDEAPWMHRRLGILRDQAPRWLRSGPHGSRIVGVYEAHQRHGGGGAFYVYLKKSR